MTILRIGTRFRQPSCNVRYCFLFFCGYHITNKSVHYVISESVPIVSKLQTMDSCASAPFSTIFYSMKYMCNIKKQNKIHKKMLKNPPYQIT